MRKRLSLLIAMVSIVISVFALNLGVALAHPGGDSSDRGIATATDPDHAGVDAPAVDNGPGDVGGIWGNPATADSEAGDPFSGIGADAMMMQIVHNPTCSCHDPLVNAEECGGLGPH